MGSFLFFEYLGTAFAYLLDMKSLLKTFESTLVLSCEASVSLVYTLGGHDLMWCVSVGGLTQDSAFSSFNLGGLRR